MCSQQDRQGNRLCAEYRPKRNQTGHRRSIPGQSIPLFRYKESAGQAAYEKNRAACCRHYDLLEKSPYLISIEFILFPGH